MNPPSVGKRTWKNHVGIRTTPETLRAYYRNYRRLNRRRLAAYESVWRKKNRWRYRDKEREQRRRWASANAVHVTAARRAYYERNHERLNAQHRRWKQQNPVRNAAHESARRARKARSGVIAAVDYEAILIRDCGLCGICGNPIPPQELEFDHIVPLSRGGLHISENIQATHSLCNRRKHSKVDYALVA